MLTLMEHRCCHCQEQKEKGNQRQGGYHKSNQREKTHKGQLDETRLLRTTMEARDNAITSLKCQGNINVNLEFYMAKLIQMQSLNNILSEKQRLS